MKGLEGATNHFFKFRDTSWFYGAQKVEKVGFAVHRASFVFF